MLAKNVACFSVFFCINLLYSFALYFLWYLVIVDERMTVFFNYALL